MSEERNIADLIRKLIGVAGFDSMLCTVVSIDDDVTCTVKSVKSDIEYENIKLNANINEDKGIYLFPKKDSYVIVTFTDRVNGFVSMFSDIERVALKIDDTVDVEIEGDVKIECKKNIEINGGDNDGLVKIKELTDKLNGLIDVFNGHTHGGVIVSVAGGVTAPATGTVGNSASPNQSQSSLSKSDYENTKIKH